MRSGLLEKHEWLAGITEVLRKLPRLNCERQTAGSLEQMNFSSAKVKWFVTSHSKGKVLDNGGKLSPEVGQRWRCKWGNTLRVMLWKKNRAKLEGQQRDDIEPNEQTSLQPNSSKSSFVALGPCAESSSKSRRGTVHYSLLCFHLFAFPLLFIPPVPVYFSLHCFTSCSFISLS